MIRFSRISHRLGAGFAALLGVFLVSGALTSLQLWRIDQARADIERSRERSAALALWIDQVNGNLQRAVLATRLDQSIGDDTALAQQLAPLVSQLNQDMAQAAQAATDIQKALIETHPDASVSAMVERIGAQRQAFVGLRGQIKDDLLMGEGQQRVEKELLPAAAAMHQAMEDLRAHLQTQIASSAQRLADSVHQVQWALLLSSAVALVAGVWLALAVARAITAPLSEAVGFAQAIAQGDLTRSLSTQRRDEIGDLLRALGAMHGGLLRLMQQVRGASGGVDAAASEIASGNQDLSNRTESAASNLQQMAARMQQLNDGMHSGAQAARTASQLAVANAEVAARGGQVVGQVVATMEDINQSSRKIHDIIGTIDGIAFQTNILALNAAVEAARAGEQGRGFAVVAAEVRNLAQRSAEAAKEIKGLIGASVDKVETGTQLVAEAGSTMGEVVANAQRVADMIGEITAASGEQSSGVEHIHGAVNQLDQMTQQNAALVEESAAAAQSLRDQAHQLSALVHTFRLP